MGSTGTGKFTDYSGQTGNEGSGGTAGGGSGGSSGVDNCDQAFAAILEEVERCAYFQQYHTPPPAGTAVVVRLRGRLSVDTESGEVLGYLPTQYNYLAGCMSSGRNYAGSVTATSITPLIRVHVDIAPA